MREEFLAEAEDILAHIDNTQPVEYQVARATVAQTYIMLAKAYTD